MRRRTIITIATAVLLGAGTAPAQAAPGDDDGWRVAGTTATWTSPTPLPVTSSRPEVLLRGVALGPAAVDGRSVTATVPAGTRPADLDVVLSGVRIDEAGVPAPQRTVPSRAGARVAPTAPLLGVDPGTPGPHAVTSSDYDLGTLPFEGFATPLEVTGHVVAPAPAERVSGKPLVLFLHGRHQYCYAPRASDSSGGAWPCAGGEKPVPSDLGYVYLQRLLASQGYTTVSISANGVNAQDGDVADGGALARSALVRRHLDAWADGEVARTVPLARGVDLDRVVLVGHSRGGEGVDLAAQQVPRDAAYRIAGEVLIGPVDFARRTAAYVSTVTLLPYCDGDVSDLQGQLFTDAARGLAPGDTALKSTVLVMGANHNFFNTEWTPGISAAPSQDDWWNADAVCGAKAAGRLKPAQQRAVGAAYVAGAVRLFAGDDPGMLAMFDGTPGRVASAGTATVHTHAVGGGRSLVLPETLTPTSSGTAVARLCTGLAGDGLRTACGRGIDSGRAPHWAPTDPEGLPTRSAAEVSWTRAGAVARLATQQPWDLSDAAHLDLRALAAPGASATVDVRVEDATGATVTLRPTNGGQVRALPGRATFGLAKLVGQQLRVPLAGVSGVDLSRVTAVSLVARSATGTVWVLDLAGTPDGLAAVPDRRLPTIALGEVRVTETGSGTQQAEVPWTLDQPLEQPARLAVLTVTDDGRSSSRVVEVPAGRTSGGFPVGYTADGVWTPERVGRVAVYPVTGVGVADGHGSVTVVDDDPAPTVRVSAPTPVREGSAVRVTVRLTRPAGVDLGVVPAFRRPATTPRVDIADLPPGWVSRHLWWEGRRGPLWRAELGLYAEIPAGRTTTTLVVPIRADRARERPERLLLDVSLPQLEHRSAAPVVVRDR